MVGEAEIQVAEGAGAGDLSGIHVMARGYRIGESRPGVAGPRSAGAGAAASPLESRCGRFRLPAL